MPAARYSAKRPRSTVPGLASSVISASAAKCRARGAPRRAHARCASAENRLGVPPPRNTLSIRRAGPTACAGIQDRARAPQGTADSGSVAAQRMRVEVAVRALGDAPREMQVERERRQHQPLRGAKRCPGAQLREERAQRERAMAHGIFLRWRKFRGAARASALARISDRSQNRPCRAPGGRCVPPRSPAR